MPFLNRVKDLSIRACVDDEDPALPTQYRWYIPDTIILVPRRFIGMPTYGNLTNDQVMELLLSAYCMNERGIALNNSMARKRFRLRRVL